MRLSIQDSNYFAEILIADLSVGIDIGVSLS